MASTFYPFLHAAPALNPPGLTNYWWNSCNDAQNPVKDPKTGLWVFFALGSSPSDASKGQNGWIGWTTDSRFQSWKPLPAQVLNPKTFGFTAIWTGGAFLDPTNAWGQGENACLITASIANPETPDANPPNMTVGLFAAPDGPLGTFTYVGALTDIATAQAQGCVMDKPDALLDSDFRDCRITQDPSTGQWILAVSVSYGIAFFTAQNPKTDRFVYSGVWVAPGRTPGQAGGVECPNLVCHRGQWLLFYSDQDSQFQNGVLRQTVMAVPGRWDGRTFTSTATPQTLNYGWSYYAQAIFEDDDGDLAIIAWANNWNIRSGTPQFGWDSQLSSVRKLSVGKGN